MSSKKFVSIFILPRFLAHKRVFHNPILFPLSVYSTGRIIFRKNPKPKTQNPKPETRKRHQLLDWKAVFSSQSHPLWMRGKDFSAVCAVERYFLRSLFRTAKSENNKSFLVLSSSVCQRLDTRLTILLL